MNRQEVDHTFKYAAVSKYMNTHYTALSALETFHQTHETTLKARGCVQSLQFLQAFSQN